MESHKRSIAKAISWRLIGAVVTIIVVYLITGKAILSIGAGVADSGVKLLIYYLHERVWNRIGFGRERAEGQALPVDNEDRSSAKEGQRVPEVAGS
jgi:adenylylsulfate kinase